MTWITSNLYFGARYKDKDIIKAIKKYKVKYKKILSGNFDCIKSFLIKTNLLILDQVLDHTARPDFVLLNAKIFNRTK